MVHRGVYVEGTTSSSESKSRESSYSGKSAVGDRVPTKRHRTTRKQECESKASMRTLLHGAGAAVGASCGQVNTKKENEVSLGEEDEGSLDSSLSSNDSERPYVYCRNCSYKMQVNDAGYCSVCADGRRGRNTEAPTQPPASGQTGLTANAEARPPMPAVGGESAVHGCPSCSGALGNRWPCCDLQAQLQAKQFHAKLAWEASFYETGEFVAPKNPWSSPGDPHPLIDKVGRIFCWPPHRPSVSDCIAAMSVLSEDLSPMCGHQEPVHLDVGETADDEVMVRMVEAADKSVAVDETVRQALSPQPPAEATATPPPAPPTPPSLASTTSLASGDECEAAREDGVDGEALTAQKMVADNAGRPCLQLPSPLQPPAALSMTNAPQRVGLTVLTPMTSTLHCVQRSPTLSVILKPLEVQPPPVPTSQNVAVSVATDESLGRRSKARPHPPPFPPPSYLTTPH